MAEMTEQEAKLYDKIKQQTWQEASCGCCKPNEEALDRVTNYVMTFYGTDIIADGDVVDTTEVNLNELYLFVIHDRKLTIEPDYDTGPD